jgi:hypothetical protein
MQELNLAYGDFMNSLIVVSSEILSDQQKWAKVKLFASAGLSLCDMITDVFMVVEYFVRKEDKYAWAILGCIIFNLTSQSILTFLQHRKNNRRRQLKEVRGQGRQSCAKFRWPVAVSLVAQPYLL